MNNIFVNQYKHFITIQYYIENLFFGCNEYIGSFVLRYYHETNQAELQISIRLIDNKYFVDDYKFIFNKIYTIDDFVYDSIDKLINKQLLYFKNREINAVRVKSKTYRKYEIVKRVLDLFLESDINKEFVTMIKLNRGL